MKDEEWLEGLRDRVLNGQTTHVSQKERLLAELRRNPLLASVTEAMRDADASLVQDWLSYVTLTPRT